MPRRFAALLFVLLASIVAACNGGEMYATYAVVDGGTKGLGGGGAGGSSPSCGPGTTECSGACVDLTTHPKHCGACDTACADQEVCSQGTCGLTCLGGATKCGDLCVDTTNDPQNCGGCNKACPMGEVCSQGACGAACSGGSTACGALCVDTQNDPQNCGVCSNACPAGEVCSQGTCALTCSGGSTQCGALCVDTQNDPQNCGACGTACPAGEFCSQGACALTCSGGSTPCGALCVDTKNDPQNCGACNSACPAGQVCAAGVCGLSCVGGTTKCGGLCTNTSFDPQNCGGCGITCNQAPNASSVCTAGACKLTCNAPFADCNNSAVDGCEKNTSTDLNNCGVCGNVCPVPANATAACSAGACGIGACNANYGNCDANAANGCEANLLTDATHCGNCATACAQNELCLSGVCVVSGKRTIFVTSTMYNGNLGGLAGADAKCQARAQAAGLPGTYMAWVSTAGGSPATRFNQAGGPFVLVNNTTVANNWADLIDSSIASAVNVTELGGAVPVGNTSCAGGGFPTVWSSTSPSGSYQGSSCSDFTSTGGGGQWGLASATNGSWTSWCSGGDCSWVSPIYCVQQ